MNGGMNNNWPGHCHTSIVYIIIYNKAARTCIGYTPSDRLVPWGMATLVLTTDNEALVSCVEPGHGNTYSNSWLYKAVHP